MDIGFSIPVADVLKEVERATHYTGGKMTDDDGAFARIGTTEGDKELLMSFWEESRADVVQAMIGILKTESFDPSKANYSITLNVSGSFDTALKDSMEVGLRGFFVKRILARWYAYTNKQEAGEYADGAEMLLKEVREKAFYRKKPERPVYTTPQ